MEKRLLNTNEIAAYLGLKPSTIRAWVKRGKIPYSKLGRAVRFDKQKIDKWLKSREIREYRGSPLDKGKDLIK